MFFELVRRNSRRNRKENGLFFGSLLVSIIAFYIVLSLSQQDVMYFLREMESDAVNRLLEMIPVFYGLTLVILFFLIYFAGRFQMERRRHEFGMYLMMGMRRGRLFAMLLAEDFGGSVIALAIGLPAAVLLSELISLVTARVVGLGIIGHRFSFSLYAVALTAAGFLVIKLAAFLILSIKISREEIGSLLAERPDETKRQFPAAVYAVFLIAGVLGLGTAYYMAIRGISWSRIDRMAFTVVIGFAGTLCLFFGLRAVFGLIIRAGGKDRKLHVFNVRQLQENVIRQSSAMAVSSLLILAALCCFGAGIAMVRHYGDDEHILDYTFTAEYMDEENTSRKKADEIMSTLRESGLAHEFSDFIEMKVGSVRTSDDPDDTYSMDVVMNLISAMPATEDRDILLNNLSYMTYPHLIALSSYNELLDAAGRPKIELGENEAAVYMDTDVSTEVLRQMMNEALIKRPETLLDRDPLYLTGEVQTTALVTDRSITLSFALILPDEAFDYYTQGEYNIFVDAILGNREESVSLMTAISEMNAKLNETGLEYESYLQNMGRQLFYTVATSYITIYLAVVFLIVANTVIGVQFLMNQQKTNRRYRTLIRLGAVYETLCRSAGKQINWYFGIPTVIAAVSSIFGVRALFTGILSSRTMGSVSEMMVVSAAMILLLCMIELIYMIVVKRLSSRYLLTLMVPEREE